MPCSPGTSSLFQSSKQRRTADKARQQRAPGIGAGAPDFGAVRERELIRAHFVRKPAWARLKRKPRRRYGIHRTWTGGVDIVETGDQRQLWVEPPGPPWHCAHARTKTALPCCSSG